MASLPWLLITSNKYTSFCRISDCEYTMLTILVCGRGERGEGKGEGRGEGRGEVRGMGRGEGRGKGRGKGRGEGRGKD